MYVRSLDGYAPTAKAETYSRRMAGSCGAGGGAAGVRFEAGGRPRALWDRAPRGGGAAKWAGCSFRGPHEGDFVSGAARELIVSTHVALSSLVQEFRVLHDFRHLLQHGERLLRDQRRRSGMRKMVWRRRAPFYNR